VTDTKTKIKFVSQLPDLNLWVKAPVYKRDETGHIERVPGHQVQFVHGVYETSDETEIEALRRDPLFGHQAGGIFEMAPDPADLKPSEAEQYDAIAFYGIQRDTKGLGELIQSEKETHNRTSVIEAAERAIRDIEDLPAETGGSAEKEKSSDSQTSKVASA
jgi:hypothetical protein